jgi:hypothetical protein
MLPSQPLKLVSVQCKQLRPTQISVGLAEVSAKRDAWAKLSPKQRKRQLKSHVVPGVLGPANSYYIVDHHHLVLALIADDVDDVWVVTLADLSWLEPAVFWRTMESRGWTHPYDAHGRRRDYRDIPKRLQQLQNDPYRSLAGLVRAAGGFAKDLAPFAEFLWADYFRPRIKVRLIEKTPNRALKEAYQLARDKEARYLPGWSGE